MIEIDTIETSSLGDRSYLATDGEVAVVSAGPPGRQIALINDSYDAAIAAGLQDQYPAAAATIQ
jgi:hypothetical protein